MSVAGESIRLPMDEACRIRLRRGRQVASIAAKGNTIQSTFKAAVRYPAGNVATPLTTLFSAEVPTFWDDSQLSALLRSRHVKINASSPTQGTSFVASLLFGFGPTLLIVGLFRRPRATDRGRRGGGALGGFGRSRARRIDPNDQDHLRQCRRDR
jgi:cell division protease FtsH